MLNCSQRAREEAGTPLVKLVWRCVRLSRKLRRRECGGGSGSRISCVPGAGVQPRLLNEYCSVLLSTRHSQISSLTQHTICGRSLQNAGLNDRHDGLRATSLSSLRSQRLAVFQPNSTASAVFVRRSVHLREHADLRGLSLTTPGPFDPRAWVPLTLSRCRPSARLSFHSCDPEHVEVKAVVCSILVFGGRGPAP
jgi:hypothetical protein